MLYNDTERTIMQHAIQKGMRFNTANQPFEYIVKDFFSDMNFQGQIVLDIGPGQCDWLDIMAQRGALTHGVDQDISVIRLGTLRRHSMLQVSSFQQEWPYVPHMFDGLFCRGSLNYFSASGNNSASIAAASFLDKVLSSAKPDAWIWIVPWIRPSTTLPVETVEAVLLATDYILRKHRIVKTIYTKADEHRYEIGFDVPFPQLWTRGCQDRHKKDTPPKAIKSDKK